MSKIMQVNVMKVLQTGEYNGAYFILQRMGNAFQYMIFWEGQFYQSYFVTNVPKGKKDFTHAQEVELAMVTNNFMQTTVDTLVATKKKILEEGKKKRKAKKMN